LMMDLGYMEEKKMMVIWCDNQGAISLTKNPTHHARTKHIDVQHHFVRERVENGEVRFEYCPTEHMVVRNECVKHSSKRMNSIHILVVVRLGFRSGDYLGFGGG
jgi:hypothetical protein